MRALLTCDWFLKYAAAQGAALAESGVDVVLLCRDHAAEFAGDLVEREATLDAARAAGVVVTVLSGRQSDPRNAAALLPIRRQVRRWSPQVVHAHDGADPRALLVAPAVPTVLTLHDPVAHPGQPVPAAGKRSYLRWGRELWRRRAAAIVVHSEALVGEVALRPGQRCAVIPHGMSVHRPPLSRPARPTVGLFGRLAPYKGLDVLARAMPRVWRERPDVHVLVAGAGETRLPLEDPRLRIERRYVPERELSGLFAQTSLAVLPYTQASQSGVGSLAVGYGVPVIVSRLGGLPDLALDESYVVEPGDDAGLARAIVAHIDDSPRLRERVLDEIAHPRSWAAAAARTLALYEELGR